MYKIFLKQGTQKHEVSSKDTAFEADKFAFEMAEAFARQPGHYFKSIPGNGLFGRVGFVVKRGLYDGILARRPIVAQITIE